MVEKFDEEITVMGVAEQPNAPRNDVFRSRSYESFVSGTIFERKLL
ncbi:major facilitator superfamily transporter [Colletotrichum graminicola]|nr:major facilitator superfamily transporter [Colletotrichum graminicola]